MGAVSIPAADSPAGADTDAVEAAGHFRIYLGAAAGVGKTYAMLNEGHRRQQRGTDVVVGFVECHGRPLTEELIGDLEVVPRQVVEYRGSRLEEMDLDAVLRRRPEVALVDELAHTNVPGSGRNEKRWQDVLEILAAGINVITTVNIQHLESIADEVEHMTGVPVRERVPDWVVRKADQIELVDSSPEQLRRRMLHGNIYPQAKVSQALANFFRTDNLTALRELALRFLADETDEELLAHLRRHESSVVWETCERVMVAVTAVPGTDALLRRAARMASRLKGELDVVHVAASDATRPRNRQAIEKLRELAADVGARWHEIRGRRSRPGHRRFRPGASDHPDRDRLQPAQPVAAADRRRLERGPGHQGGGRVRHRRPRHRRPRGVQGESVRREVRTAPGRPVLTG